MSSSAAYVASTTKRSEASTRRCLRGGPSGGIVPAPLPCHLGEWRRGAESIAELVLELVQGLDHPGGTKIVDHPKRAAAECGKPDAEHRADIAVPRTPHYLFGAGGGRLVEHREHQAPLDQAG